ncbi:MAG: hypothetical protein AAFU55_09485 [Pseudomonadota bacterium]
MRYASLDDYLKSSGRSAGPIALLVCEDDFLVEETVRHLRKLGFSSVVATGPGADSLQDAEEDKGVAVAPTKTADAAKAANAVGERFAGVWTLVCHNAEFPFFPFCETRLIDDFVDFLGSERRAACMGYAVDLYSDAMISGESVDLGDVYFDAEGWYGFDRDSGHVDVYGGLGWRFEEYAPLALSRVNRPCLFRAGSGTRLRADLWLEDDALNTLNCPWHNNPTMALMSFRRGRRLLAHPNFKSAIDTLIWPNARRFDWNSEQLVRLGLIEAGQWI